MQRKDFLKFIASFDLGVKKLYKLFEFYTQEELDFDIIYEEDFLQIVGKESFSKIKENANMHYFEKFSQELFDKNIKLISVEDDVYPQKLREIEDSPFFLFYKGDLSLLNQKAIAIVGTRMPTNYGKVITDRFAKELAENGVVIVSGLAYGVDSIAHRKALEVGGKTIAVLGSGINKIYPSQHTDLAREIAEKGLLISEYSPNVQAGKYTFPQRNRIVAGLSDGVLITEAGAKSGTIITKDFALDNGIPIYAVPGNITSEKSEGTNNIIAHSQGMCVLSGRDILDDLGVKQKTNKSSIQLTFEEQMIYDLLCEGEKDVDCLFEKTKIDINRLTGLLISLEIRDIIKKMAGGFFAIA